MTKKFIYFLAIISALKVFKISFSLIKFIYRHFIYKSNFKKLNQDDFAIITGCNSLLGQEFALQLKLMGFNIILIDDNSEITEQLINKLKINSHNNQKFINLVLDEKIEKNKNFEKFFHHLIDKNITIYINAKERFELEKFQEQNELEIINLIKTNCILPSLLIRNLLKKLCKKRITIILLSSFFVKGNYPYISVYTSTKSYLEILAKLLRLENENVNLICLKTCFSNIKSEINIERAQRTVYGCLNKIGVEEISWGDWKEEIKGFILEGIPNFIQFKIFHKLMKESDLALK